MMEFLWYKEIFLLNEFNNDFEEYEAELIKIENVAFDSLGIFENGTVYSITDVTANSNFRTTFYDVDYIGTAIPDGQINFCGICNSRTDGEFITARNLADFEILGDIPVLTITPETLDFGVIEYGTLYEIDGVLSNIGTAELIIDSITYPSESFGISERIQLPIIIPVGASVNVTFTVLVEETDDINFEGVYLFEGNITAQELPANYTIETETADIVINEIHYNPPSEQGNDDIYEFLELYNNSEFDAGMGNWSFDGISFTFDENFILAVGEYVVIATNPDSCMSFYGIENVVGPFSGALGNGGEMIQLLDASGNVVDEVEYDDGGDWPSAPDGDGASLELIDPSFDNSLAENWQASYQLFGTPGTVNSEPQNAVPHTIYEIQFSEEGPSSLIGERVLTSGIVTAVFENNFFIQDGTGAWNGIIVDEFAEVNLGDEIELEATVGESNDRTNLNSVSNLNILSSTNELPLPEIISTADLASEEMYEGVLVKISNVTVTNEDLGYGEWEVDDSTGACVIDDYGTYTYIPVLDDFITSVTGVVEFSYGAYKLEPRDDLDFLFETLTYGDVDENGVIQAYDASITLQYSIGLDPLPVIDPLPWEDWRILTADVDGNGEVQAFDAALILQYSIGLITVFPVEERNFIAPESNVKVSVCNNELVFVAEGELFGFEVNTGGLDIEMPDTDLLICKNGNSIAIASATALNGEFLRIPFKGNGNSNVKLEMVINTEKVEKNINLLENNVQPINQFLGNFPNPFNPVTYFNISLIESSNVTIHIYNIKGENVHNYENNLDAGQHNIKWNADNKASGVYFYKVDMNGREYNGKVLLLK